MGDVLAFARLAHAVTLDGFGENDGRLPGMLYSHGISGIHLLGIVAAAAERPNFVVAHVLHKGGCLGIFVEELLAHIGAVLRLEILIFAVYAFFHALAQLAALVLREEPIPAGTPQHLDDVPAGTVE